MTVSSVLLLGLVLIAGAIWQYLRSMGPYLKLPTSFSTLKRNIVFCIRCLMKRNYAQKNILRITEEVCRKYEKEGLYAVWIFLPIVFIFHKEYVKKILNGPAAKYKPLAFYNLLKYFIGNNVFLSNGAKWKRKKKIMKLGFQLALREKKIQIINKQSGNLVKTLSRIPNNSTKEILDILKHFTIQISIESIYGIEQNFEGTSLMCETFEKIFPLTLERVFKPWLYPDFSLNIFPEGRECLKPFKKVMSMLPEMMESLKENMLTSNKNLSNMKPEFIGEALFKEHLQDPSYTMNELTTDLFFLTIVSFHTSYTTLMWCLHLLGLHEEVQERLYTELEELKGDLCADDLSKMEYTECVIRESLRVYSAIPFVLKYLEEDVQCGKYTIPKGTTIVLPLYILHKNSDVFPDPEKFDPERFRKNKNGDSAQLYTASFSEGLRPCIGKMDAINELKIMIAYIVRNFKIISLDKQKDFELFYDLVLTPSKPLQMQFIPRCALKEDDSPMS